MADRTCASCGRSLAPDARYCAGCGNPVQDSSRKAPEAEISTSTEPRDPNIRAEDYGETPSRPSWWRWIFRGGS